MASTKISPKVTVVSEPARRATIVTSGFSDLGSPRHTTSVVPTSSMAKVGTPREPPAWSSTVAPPFLATSLDVTETTIIPYIPRISDPVSSDVYTARSPATKMNTDSGSAVPGKAPEQQRTSLPADYPVHIVLGTIHFVASTVSPGITFKRFLVTTYAAPKPSAPA